MLKRSVWMGCVALALLAALPAGAAAPILGQVDAVGLAEEVRAGLSERLDEIDGGLAAELEHDGCRVLGSVPNTQHPTPNTSASGWVSRRSRTSAGRVSR